MRQLPRSSDVEFDPMNDLAEMTRIASSYTARLNAEQVRRSRIGRFIWFRLDVRSSSNPRSRPRCITTNLVFRLATDSPRPVSFIRPFRQLHSAAAPPQTP